MTKAVKFDRMNCSDHAPIGVELLATAVPKPKTFSSWQLDRQKSTVEIAQVLAKSHWPLKQFNRDVVCKEVLVLKNHQSA